MKTKTFNLTMSILFILAIYFISAEIVFEYNPTNINNFNFLGYISIDILVLITNLIYRKPYIFKFK